MRPLRILVAMSGGVDSSVAAALLRDQGHEVIGVTLRLWGGASDSGCCSVSDVEDARRVADQLDIPHYVFNFADDFEHHVVHPYVAAHVQGTTPNPCVECNRHIKFDRLLRRCEDLGADRVATGHHARIVSDPQRGPSVARGADRAKDQSYVLHPLGPSELARTIFPVGELTKDEVRGIAGRLGLRTAAKADSQDVCFITRTEGRDGFLGRRIELHPATVVDGAGHTVGEVEAVELVTVGQRRGLRLAGGRDRRYVVDVDVEGRMVRVGSYSDLLVSSVRLESTSWSSEHPPGGRLEAQCSAHGTPVPAVVEGDLVRFLRPRPRVAPGQSVVLYDGDVVVGGGIAT